MPSFSWFLYLHQWTPLPSLPKGRLLEGKTLVITGANSGVGLESIKQLIKYAPARVILAVRSVESAEKVAKALRHLAPAVQVEVWYLDLTKMESIKAFAERAKGLEHIDVLMNNAGINPNFSAAPIKSTEDGYERVIQTNVLGTLLLTLLLQPVLSRTAQTNKSRDSPLVVFTGSDVHSFADPSLITEAIHNGEPILAALNDEEKYDNSKRYMLSKLLLQMVTRSLITALPNTRIINVNPGLARTNLGREFNFKPSFGLIYEIAWYLLNARSAASGAKNLTTAVVNSKDSVDYWSECEAKYSESTFLPTAEGYRTTQRVYRELVDECEKLVPGSTACLV